MLEKTSSKVIVVFTIISGVGGIVALGQWANLDDNWRFGAIGFILGVVVVLIPAVVIWDGPYRRERLSRERKKLALVQALPTRNEYINDLRITSEQLQVEIAKAKADVEFQSDLATNYWRKGNDFLSRAHESAATDAEHDIWLKQQEWERLVDEYTRVYDLTDEQWRAEQEAKIYVPD